MFSSVHKLSNDDSTSSPSHQPASNPSPQFDVSEHDADTSTLTLLSSNVDSEIIGVDVEVSVHAGKDWPEVAAIRSTRRGIQTNLIVSWKRWLLTSHLTCLACFWTRVLQ